MGRQEARLLGPAARDGETLFADHWTRLLAKMGIGPRIADALWLPILSWTGPMYEESGLFGESAGIADALQLSRTDSVRLFYGGIFGGSTSFAATRSATLAGGATIGRNIDWADDGGVRRPVLVHYHPDNGDLAYISVGWQLGRIPIAGLNEAGLAVSINFFEADEMVGLLFPQFGYRRILQRARTVDEAIGELNTVRNLGGPGFLVMADAGGAIAMAECRPSGCALYRPKGDWFAQANHARTAEMIPHDRGRVPDSFGRLAAMEAAVGRRVGSIDPAIAAEILRDRSSSAYVNDSIVANLFVMNSLVIESATKTLWHSTSKEPIAPFGEMVAFSPTSETKAESLDADPRLETSEMRHQLEVINRMREATRLTDSDHLAEALALWNGVAQSNEPFVEPSRLAWARARILLKMGRNQEADHLLEPLDRDGTPDDVRAFALVARAGIAQRSGRPTQALATYRRASAFLASVPQYSGSSLFALAHDQVVRGLAGSLSEDAIVGLPDLALVPR
jgi:tetratricopeptide (TPR) repeat protein